MNPSRKKSYIAILFVAAMDNFGFGISYVLFPLLFLKSSSIFLPPEASIGMRNFYLALSFIVFPLSQLFAAPLLGDYSDMHGRKKTLVITIIGSLGGFILSALSVTWGSLFLFISSRFLSGFFAGNLSLCLSSIADLSPTEKERARNFGTLTVVWVFSWTIAMIVSGYLASNPSLPFWATALFAAISLWVLVALYTETHPNKEGVRFDLLKGIHHVQEAFLDKRVRPYFFVLLSWIIGWGISVQWFASYSILRFQAGSIAISWSLLIQGIFWLFGGLVINPFLLRRLSPLRIALFGFVATAFFLFISAAPHNFFLFVTFYCMAAIFSQFSFSNGMTLISTHATAEVQGKVMGLSQSVMSFGWIIVPILGGIAGAKAIGWFYPLAGLVLVIAVIILSHQIRSERGDKT